MSPSAAEANPLANLKQEMALNHSMAMDQLGRLSREVNKLKPTMEELQTSVTRTSDRMKQEVADEMMGMSGRITDMERTLKEDLEAQSTKLQDRLVGTLQEQVQAQQAALDHLSKQLEELARNTSASLAQLRMALTMAEVEAQVRQRNPEAHEVALEHLTKEEQVGKAGRGKNNGKPNQPGKVSEHKPGNAQETDSGKQDPVEDTTTAG